MPIKLDDRKRAFEEFKLHTNLFWSSTSIFTAAIVGLYLHFAAKEQKDIDGIIPFSGLVLTGIVIYFGCSFRVLKDSARDRAKIKAFKNHLPQWPVYLLIWWFVGILWIRLIYDKGYWPFQIINSCLLTLIWTLVPLVAYLLFDDLLSIKSG